MKTILFLLFILPAFAFSQTIPEKQVTNLTTDLASLKNIDVFLIAGQSNARGTGSASTSPHPDANTVYQYDASAFSNVTTGEVGNLPSGRGSAWPSFGIEYYNITGNKICFVPAAVDGSGQLSTSNTGFGDWGTSGSLYAASVTKLNAALAAIVAAGYNPIFKGVLWMQGENDGDAINATSETKANYKAGLQTMISNYRSVYGANMPFYMFRIGTRVGFSDVGFSSVRDAQVEVAADTMALTRIVFYNAVDYPARSLMADTYHFLQAGYNEMGQIGAENVVSAQNRGWQRQGVNSLYYPLGNVGIGVDVPAYSLDVNSTTSPNAQFKTNVNDGNLNFIIQNLNSGSSAAGGFRFYNDGGLNAQLGLGSSGSTANPNGIYFHSLAGIMRVGSNSSSVELFTGSTGPLASNVRFRILNNGNIGIGANYNATRLFDVNGVGKFQDSLLAASVLEAQGKILARSLATGTTSDSLLVVSGGEIKRVLQSSVGGGGGTSLNGTGYVKMSGTTPSYVATIPNADLTNSSVVVGTTTIALGGTAATLTGMNITPRTVSTTSASTLTLDFTSFDLQALTAQAAALTIANPSSTPAQGQIAVIRIKDNGTARAITFGTQYRGIGLTLPTTTVANRIMYITCVWNFEETKVDVLSVSQE